MNIKHLFRLSLNGTAIAKQSAYLGAIENISFWAFLLGGLIGLTAQLRGEWL